MSEQHQASNLASGWTVEGETTPAGPSAEHPPTDHPHQRPHHLPGQLPLVSVVFVSLFGALYLVYTWLWILIAREFALLNAINVQASGSVGGMLQSVLYWLIPTVPLLWFVTAYLLARRHQRPLIHAVTLLLGSVVLVPLPAFIGGPLA